MKHRIYRYDNLKALLILLVVIGHMTTDYVSDSHMVRWITLWIYTFHMPAFIFISGLVHRRYTCDKNITGIADAAAVSPARMHSRPPGSLWIDTGSAKCDTRLRSDKVLGFFFCAYGLKVFLQLTRTLMGQHPLWHWIAEPGIPWYLFVMAEYELLFYLMRRIDGKTRPAVMIAGALALSAAVGYFPAIGDTLCLSRMINFLPIYMIGYYLDMNKVNDFLSRSRYVRAISAVILAASLAICCMGRWGMYSWRKWFTGRRSYEFLSDYFSYAVRSGWWIRIAVWGFALLITFALLALIPDIDLGYITVTGAKTLQVYFWHRPVCYMFRTLKILSRLAVLTGGTYNEAVAGQIKGLAFGGSALSMAAALIIYFAIGAAMTAFFSLRIFEHPTSDLLTLGAKAAGILRK